MKLAYRVGQSGETLILTADVAAHLSANRQLKWWQSESCGLLFALIEGREIVVCDATGPYPRAWRARFGCAIDPVRAQQEIDDRHPSGLHYIGEWHSHPEPVPNPSGRDEATMKSRVTESSHALNGFIFMIVGQADLPLGLTVLLHDGSRSFTLRPD
jgi:integrative and conjugative element protein (TIGR02256 family)